MLIILSILEVLLSGRSFSDRLTCWNNFRFTEKLQIVLRAPVSPCPVSVSPHINILHVCSMFIKPNIGIMEFQTLFGIYFSTDFLVLFQDLVQDTTCIWLYVALCLCDCFLLFFHDLGELIESFCGLALTWGLWTFFSLLDWGDRLRKEHHRDEPPLSSYQRRPRGVTGGGN